MNHTVHVRMSTCIFLLVSELQWILIDTATKYSSTGYALEGRAIGRWNLEKLLLFFSLLYLNFNDITMTLL